MRRYYFWLLLVALHLGWHEMAVAQAEKNFSLAQCVDIAQANNLELQSLQLNGQTAQINERQARFSRLPDLNFNTQYGLNFGRVIDPTTNSFDNASSSIQTYGLSSNMSVYQGGLINRTIEQAQFAQSSADFRADALKDNVGLRVAQQYLNALLARESLKVAQLQIDLTDENLKRVDALIKAGSSPANDRLEFEAQRATNEEEVINAQNNLDLAKVQLANLMRLPLNLDFSLEEVPVDQLEFNTAILDMSAEDVFRAALVTQPSIKADSFDLLTSSSDIAIAKARMRPTVSVGGSVTSNYSSLSQEVIDTRTEFNEIPIVIGGNQVDVGFPTTVPTFSDRPYVDQLDDNLGFGVGVNLRLPIFNGLSARSDWQRAEVSYQQRQIDAELNRQTLLNDVQTALTTARAARARYISALKRIEAQKTSYDMMARRVELGAGNSFDLVNIQNNYKVAQLSLIQAKYDYLFRLKVIDFYLGNPIR